MGILTRELSETLDVFPNIATSWDYFNDNRNEILGLIDVNEFESMYSNYIEL